ncbi:MAG: hypothetical protein INH03_09125, partial [Rhodocyclaceae bacterium]|nr:hypothetical protein [Rhodocyclaceae bacterium]
MSLTSRTKVFPARLPLFPSCRVICRTMENLRTLPSLARRALRRFLLLVLALQAGALLDGLPAQVPVARAQAAGATEPSARPLPPFLQPLLPARPRMVVAEARLPIQVVRVRVDAEIVGMAARTRIEMEFRNPNERVLEGELQFPLRPG